jgi:adenosylhomocysteinase
MQSGVRRGGETPFLRPGPMGDARGAGLSAAGEARIAWAERKSPVLRVIGERFRAERPLEGLTVAACLQVTAETAVLIRILESGGARVWLAASNPLSTQEEIAAALEASGSAVVFASTVTDLDTYYGNIHRVIDSQPDLVMDDGGDLVNILHAERQDALAGVRAGCESTMSGIIRMRRMAEEGTLAFPVAAVSDSAVKRLADNACGTGQSVIDGILRATNTLLAGATVVVAGYGPCGMGIASCARGLGASVIVTEIDPMRALEAAVHGYRVMPMLAAAPLADVVITATGSRDVVGRAEFDQMRDGAIIANAGHFDVEVDVRTLAAIARDVHYNVRPHTDEYVLADGRRMLLVAEGRVVNLVAAEGHPPAVMDMAFACGALVLAWLAQNAQSVGLGVHEVPSAIDAEVARLKLASLGADIDVLTETQRTYFSSWQEKPT